MQLEDSIAQACIATLVLTVVCIIRKVVTPAWAAVWSTSISLMVCICIALTALWKLKLLDKSPFVRALMPVFLVGILFAQYAAATALLIWQPPCAHFCIFDDPMSLNSHRRGELDLDRDDVAEDLYVTVFCVWVWNSFLLYGVVVVPCRLFAAFIISIVQQSSQTVRFTAVVSIIRLALFIIDDVVFIALWHSPFQHRLAETVVSACAILFTGFFTAWASRTSEELRRAEFALERALHLAVNESRAMLDDLFPPQVVTALLDGCETPPQVIEVVAMHCDLKVRIRFGIATVLTCSIAVLYSPPMQDYTVLGSHLQPVALMSALDRLYSAFDDILKNESNEGILLSKLDTV